MNRRNELGGVIPATVTPFTPDERIDAAAMLRLMDWNLGQGVEGFFIGGSSAECFLLSPAEREQAFEIASERRDRAFLAAHVGAISTREAEGYARRAAQLGFDAVAATPPFYYGFDSADIFAYYESIAQAAGMPVLIYNFPGNTHKPFDLEDPVTRRLFTSDFILGVKHTNQAVYQMERIRQLNPRLKIMNGFDETMVAGLALGADGSIGSTFNFMFPHYQRIYTLFRERRIDEALAAQVKANNIMAALCRVGLIPAIKYVLAAMGVPVGPARRPFRMPTDEQRALLDQVIAENLIV